MKKNDTLLVLFATMLLTSVTQAFWYGESVEAGSDIMMMDLRWPFWSESTYYANWNSGIAEFSFYGGFNSVEPSLPPDFYPNMDPEVQQNVRPGAIWTFWGKNPETGEPVRTLATSRYNYLYQYVGEGASGAFYGLGWPIVQNQWYTMIIRVWKPVGIEGENYYYIGRWTKDVQANHWYLFGVAKLPTKINARFNGNAGFLEDFGNGCRSVRSIHRRRGYCRVNGEWKSTHLNVLLGDKTSEGPFAWAYVPRYMDDNTVIAIENCGLVEKLPFQHKGNKVAEFGKNHVHEVKQPSKPTFDKLIVENVRAESNGQQVVVSWTVPASSAPQIHYKVEVFDNPECTGTAVAIKEQSLPYIQNALLSAKVIRPTIRLTVTDIFDNETKSITVQADAKTKFTPSVPGKGLLLGLRYEYLIKDEDRHINVLNPAGKSHSSRTEKHYWVSLDELKDGKLVQQGISNGFDISLRGNRNHGYGFRFDGYLKVPETGFYLFSVRGTDGFRLNVDKKTAMEWDGLHGPEYRFFYLNLEKGFHPVSVEYFLDSRPPFFEIQWEGPGFDSQVIPSTALYHKADRATPEIAFSVINATTNADTLHVRNGKVTSKPAVGSEKQMLPGMVTVKLDIDAKGQTIEKIDIYHGTVSIASMTGNDASEQAVFKGVLPQGKKNIWIRVFYNHNYTIDSFKVPVNIGSVPIKDWNLEAVGEKNLPCNILQTASDTVSFTGEGDYVLTRPVKGDFTLTAKIDSYMRSDKHPVNKSAWVGVCSLGHGLNQGLYQWADGHIRTNPDFPDVQGQRCGTGLYGNNPWLRIVRKGNFWSTWTSKDGNEWKLANSCIGNCSEQVNAGIMFSALPQDRLVYFSASVSNISIEQGVPENLTIKAKPAEGTALLKTTGIAVAMSNPNVVVLRTVDRGLLRSNDKGMTWSPANGKLSGPANAVRSVAIDPKNPDIMYRAAGYADNAGKFTGGLYKTIDAGKTWELLPLQCDFDAKGPSAICGEIIAVNNSTPNELLVGAETKGLFKSTDSGRTWKQILPGDQRFTTVKFNRFPNGPRREVYAITCHDSVMEILGRGENPFKTTAKGSRIYKSDDSGARFVLKSENPSRGYLNQAFFNFPGHELMLGTTHGYEYSCSSGATTYLFSGHPNLEHLRPITAIASSIDETHNGLYSRTLMQAINPEKINQLCIGGHHWFWPGPTPVNPPYKGVIKIWPGDLGNKANGREWWFLGLNGVYYTDDKCRTFKKMR